MGSDAWKNIEDPDVRKVFERGAENGTLEFLYATKPSSTKYYVFLYRDENGDPHERTLTKMQVIGEQWRAPS